MIKSGGFDGITLVVRLEDGVTGETTEMRYRYTRLQLERLLGVRHEIERSYGVMVKAVMDRLFPRRKK